MNEILSVKLHNDLFIDFHKLGLVTSLWPLILKHRTVLNFKEHKKQIELTTCLMQNVFHMKWKLPQGNLCPAIPSRMNYLMWIHFQSGVNIKHVIDIGTGASLIYPLLGHALFKWHFTALQQDSNSFASAQHLITINSLQSSVYLYLTPKNKIVKGVLSHNFQADVVICNPPFFDNSNHHTLSLMKDSEKNTEGGQYQFFFQIFRDSFSFPKIQVWSCLFGLKSSYQTVKDFMQKEINCEIIRQVKFGEIKQGNTIRYIVMWKHKHNKQ